MAQALAVIQIVKEVASLFKTSDSLTISDLKTVDGFEKIDNKGRFSKGTIEMRNLGKLIDIFMRDELLLGFSQQFKTAAKLAVEELLIQVFAQDPMIIKNFDIYFNKGNGKICMMHMVFGPCVDDKLKYMKCIVDASFKLAQPYIIVTTCDSDIFGSSCEQHIRYMPAIVKPEHVASILNMNAMMASVMIGN